MSGEGQLLDTNILVHAYLQLDAAKHAVAARLVQARWQQGTGLTTVQNVCEFFAVVTRRVAQPLPAPTPARIVRDILTYTQWRVIDRRGPTVSHAMELVQSYQVPFWDALIAATMLEHHVCRIATENERDFQRVPGVEVINPFIAPSLT